MDDIQKAVELAVEAFHKEFGEDAKFEDGDEVVFVLNNCILIISLEDGHLQEKFIGGKPLIVDHTLKVYESEEK